MIRLLVAVIFLLSVQDAHAYNMKKCFDYQTKSALYRKYDFKYLAPTSHPSDSVNISVPTDTTSKEGFSKWSTQNSVQGSTMIFDPGVSTKSSTGNSQFISSWGECSMLGFKDPIQKRHNFIASNWDELQTEISIGQGGHLSALLSMSGCTEMLQPALLTEIRQGFATYTDAMALARHFDDLLSRFPFMGCHGRLIAAH